MAIFLFTRDLRLTDNVAFIDTLKNYETVIPIFIYDNHQIGKGNSYRSRRSIKFMQESVSELRQEMNNKLNIFYGKTKVILNRLRKKYKIDDVVVSKDYTPFAKERRDECNLHEIENVLLCPDDVTTSGGKPYVMFTPFYRKSVQIKVRSIIKFDKKLLQKCKAIPCDKIKTHEKICCAISGGRSNGLKLLKAIKTKQKNYAKDRDFPSSETSHLSAHHKFGTISIRETYWEAKEQLSGIHRKTFISQLYWRDFYYRIIDNHPHVLGSAFKSDYDNIKWSKNKTHFEAWCQGKTGFPIVDAGMRQLNETGWMHNRLRMIVASFLTKDLLLDWRWGEKYFAQQLVDYDPAQNNGGWQWAASTGTDSQPYFRIFNPWSQSKKFDANGIYIKKFVPEVKDLNNKFLHKDCLELTEMYMEPIVVHKEQREKALVMYKNAIYTK